MRAADYVVDLGPGAGEQGGHVLYAGPGGDALTSADTDTARYLRGERRVDRRRVGGAPERFVTVEGASHNNLRDVTARIPPGADRGDRCPGSARAASSRRCCIARSAAATRNARKSLRQHRAVRAESMNVALVDQSPTARRRAACPVTYLGAPGGAVRAVSRQPTAIARGPGWSVPFNTPGGRCEAREGALGHGRERLLADLRAPEVCHGARFRPEVLEVRYRGLNI